MAGREPASPSGGANPGVAQVPVGGELAGSREHPTVRRTPCGRCPSAGFSQLRYDGLLQHVRADIEGPREESNILAPLMLSVQRRSEPAFAGVSRFPPPKEMGSSSQPLTYAVHSVRDPTAGRLASVTESQALHWAARPGVPGGARF